MTLDSDSHDNYFQSVPGKLHHTSTRDDFTLADLKSDIYCTFDLIVWARGSIDGWVGAILVERRRLLVVVPS